MSESSERAERAAVSAHPIFPFFKFFSFLYFFFFLYFFDLWAEETVVGEIRHRCLTRDAGREAAAWCLFCEGRYGIAPVLTSSCLVRPAPPPQRKFFLRFCSTPTISAHALTHSLCLKDCEKGSSSLFNGISHSLTHIHNKSLTHSHNNSHPHSLTTSLPHSS